MHRSVLRTVPLCCILCLLPFLTASCSKTPEITIDELERTVPQGTLELLAKTVSKPWQGEEFVPGKTGGTWLSSVTADPKSFNLLIAERDGETAALLEHLTDYLVDYDYVRHEFKPHAASFEITVNEEKQTMSVYYTLRDNLYWSRWKNGKAERIMPVTSDDVVFWYNEIEGDAAFHSSAYNSQFTVLADGTTAHIDIEKIDDKTFAFHFPRIDSNPLLSTNRTFGPKFVYEPAKREKGVQGVMDLHSVAVDPQEIPSMGQWFLTEYTPGQRLVFRRNSDYWRKDTADTSVPYPDTKIVQILSDQNTQFLLFKQGRLETYGARPEDIDELVQGQDQSSDPGETGAYTVFNAAGALGASMWSFNQNPRNSAAPYYRWFTCTAFRQAMSCLLNRDRIIAQTYRGLAEPKLTFFAEPNPFFNADITLQYTFNPEKARALLASAGMHKNEAGILTDDSGIPVAFDLSIPADNSIVADMAAIIADECKKEGITVNIRAVDFQKLVEQLTATYDWQSILIGLGSNYWPTQGSNVWPSNGNLHLWYPLQETPATEWEARIDWLYNEGSATADTGKAWKIWDEYQRILLEQCPVIYLVRPRSFFAIRNKWDLTNMYYDNIGGAQTVFVSLKQ